MSRHSGISLECLTDLASETHERLLNTGNGNSGQHLQRQQRESSTTAYRRIRSHLWDTFATAVERKVLSDSAPSRCKTDSHRSLDSKLSGKRESRSAR